MLAALQQWPIKEWRRRRLYFSERHFVCFVLGIFHILEERFETRVTQPRYKQETILTLRDGNLQEELRKLRF